MVERLNYLADPYVLTALICFGLWLFWLWIWQARPQDHEDYLERMSESYDLIQNAYLTICAQGFVTDEDWEKICQADWMAKTFLDKELRTFTLQWVKTATNANLLHKNMGKFGHLDLGGTARQKEEIKGVVFSVENKSDEITLLDWLKENDPTSVYKKYLPALNEKNENPHLKLKP